MCVYSKLISEKDKKREKGEEGRKNSLKAHQYVIDSIINDSIVLLQKVTLDREEERERKKERVYSPVAII